MTGWHKANMYGAQEEKFGTLIPEMMLATEPLRMMGAGLLSSGKEDPWLPEAGWYIIGAGTYVQSKGYPNWSPAKVPLSDADDYFAVGTGRRIRKRGIVAILAKPCNDRGSCKDNTDTDQFRCYNRQVADHDIAPTNRGGGANLWGIAGGAFNFANWPAKTAQIMETEQVTKNWVLQAGGWGAGAFGCGTLYNGLVQALAAKKGGWTNMRMCYATKDEPYPSILSKLGYTVAGAEQLKKAKVINAENYRPLLALSGASEDHHTQPAHKPPSPHGGVHKKGRLLEAVAGRGGNSKGKGKGKSGSNDKLIFSDHHFGAVARQLYKKIDQKIVDPVCYPDEEAPPIKCNRPGNQIGDCYSNMKWCCENEECDWHKNEEEDLRDFAARTCNPMCSKAKGFCKSRDVPAKCRKESPPNAAEDVHVHHSNKPPPPSTFPAKPKGASHSSPSHNTPKKTYKAAAARDFDVYEAEAEATNTKQSYYDPSAAFSGGPGYSSDAAAYDDATYDEQAYPWVPNPEGDSPYAKSARSSSAQDFAQDTPVATPRGIAWFNLAFLAGGCCIVGGVVLLIAPKSCFGGGTRKRAPRNSRGVRFVNGGPDYDMTSGEE